MLAAGSIEEKVFERQLSKEGLSGIATNDEVDDGTRLGHRAPHTRTAPQH